MGLDPATQPFKLLSLQGKLVMYCDRGGVAQLCKIHRVSHEITNRTKETDLYIVTAKAKTQDRETESIGAVNISGLKGEALANALMKAETKAKRRATLDLLGLGILDETETGTIPGAQTVDIADEGADESTRMRHLRAALNKALQECKDEPAFRKVCSEFQKAHGKGIWAALTCHNQTETFTMLADEHRGRILSADILQQLVDLGLSGFPRVSLTRETLDSEEISGGCVDLSVSSEVKLDITVDGLVSCNSVDDCPDGLACNASLFCE
jgi:hypothetical protein